MIALSQKTKESENFKIWQAVEQAELVYKEPYYFHPSLKIKEALDKLVKSGSKFAVVRQYDQELGMVSEAAIREFFKMFPVDEEAKDEEFAGRQIQFQQMRWNVNDSLPNASFLENFNKTIRNSYGSEIVMYNSLSQEIKLDDQLNSFMLLKEEQKYRISDGRPSNLSNSDFIGSQISFGFNN